MVTFQSAVTSEQVVAAFTSQVRGRVFVITGAASPAHILIASRTAAAVEPVLSAILEIDPAVKTTFVQVDLSDHESVRRAAKDILAATDGNVDILINSAGNMALKDYTVDKQGIEMQFSVNHVGHFLLTNLLTPALLAAAAQSPNGARVVNLTSAGYQISPVRYEDPGFSDGRAYDPWSGYGQAKTAQMLFASGFTERLKHRGIVAFACHPGSNLDTKLGSHLVMEDYADILPITKRNTGNDFVFTVGDEPRFKTIEQIGATPLIAALDPDLVTRAPAYLQNGRIVQPTVEHAYGDVHVDRCWKLSEELIGQRFEYT